MKILLTTLNAKYIHKNLALRWLYVSSPKKEDIVLKEYTIKEDVDLIVSDIVSMQVDLVAFSTYIWNIENTMQIVKKLKEQTNINIVLGGPEVTFESYHLLEEGVDALSLGEGEIALWKYVEMLSNKEEYEIEGIYTKKHPNTHVCKVDLKVNETYENPYFLNFDEKENGKRYFYLETSRGCPYGCEYCLSSTDCKVRLFSEEYVYSILEKLKDSEVRIVKLLDRTFNIYPERALRLARFMNEHCKNQIFQFEVVAETLSEDILNFFIYEADKNRFRLEIGVQSFHDQTLKAVGRYQNNERLTEVITRLAKAGVVMHVDLIAGLPYEGIERFKQSFNTLYDLHASEIQLGILKLLKGTNLKAKKDVYSFKYSMTPPYDVVSTAWLSEEELVGINKCAMAVEKCYNNGRMRNSIDTILNLGLYSDAFGLFYAIGEKMAQLPRPYHTWHVFSILKEVLINQDENLVDAILNYDYYRLFKQKPKMFLKDKLNHEIRKEISTFLLEKGIISTYEMHHYTHIDTIYYKNKIGIQAIVYSNKQSYPKRWFISENKVEEIE